MSKPNPSATADFPKLFGEIKARIQQAQARAVLSVNAELVRLYWDIGQMIHARQHQEGWGSAVIPRLAGALHNELPEEKGFSERNLKYMIRFYREYATVPIVQQPAAQLSSQGPLPKVQQPAAQLSAAAAIPVAQRTAVKSELLTVSMLWSIPWFHHIVLMEKVKDMDDRLWYMAENRTPLSVAFGHVAPGGSGTQNPKHSIEGLAMIVPSSAAFLPGKQAFD